MGKRWLFLIIPASLLLIGFLFARLTGGLQIYVCSTPASEPAIPVGKIFFASKFKEPEKGDHITFKSSSYHDSMTMLGTVGQTYFFRLVAEGGDVVEMKNGVCFVNNQNFDADKNLLQEYIIHDSVVNLLPNRDELEKKQYISKLNEDSSLVFLSTLETSELNKKGMMLQKNIYNYVSPEVGVFKWLKKDTVWSIDHFGPLKIPDGFLFVMGDNRHNSLDSRYVGFIKKENFMGTVLNIQ